MNITVGSLKQQNEQNMQRRALSKRQRMVAESVFVLYPPFFTFLPPSLFLVFIHGCICPIRKSSWSARLRGQKLIISINHSLKTCRWMESESKNRFRCLFVGARFSLPGALFLLLYFKQSREGSSQQKTGSAGFVCFKIFKLWGKKEHA